MSGYTKIGDDKPVIRKTAAEYSHKGKKHPIVIEAHPKYLRIKTGRGSISTNLTYDVILELGLKLDFLRERGG